MIIKFRRKVERRSTFPFVGKRYIYFPSFLKALATEHLIGEVIQPKHLNDHRLGRVLDKLYLTRLSQIFMTIAIEAAQQFNVALETAHYDC